MKDKILSEDQIDLFWKKWNENIIYLHWKMYKLGKEIDNENTSLWKQLCKKG